MWFVVDCPGNIFKNSGLLKSISTVVHRSGCKANSNGAIN